MANVYKKVYFHVVFAVKNRGVLLHKSWRSNLFAYMSGVLRQRGHFPLAVNGHLDHVHLLFDYSLKELPSDLVRELKKASTAYIKNNNLCPFNFQWQSGYGLFSVGWKEKDQMINYIKNQDRHHSKHSFKAEYLSLLNLYDIEFQNEYIFEFFD